MTLNERPPKKMAYDGWLFLTALPLVVCGLFMVASSSPYVAMDYGKDPSAFYWKQAAHAVVGLGLLIAALWVPYRTWNRRWLIFTLLAVCVAALLLVLAMPSAGGAHRWIMFGPLRFQPSEFAKLFVVVFMAFMLSRKEDRVNDPWSVPIPCMAVVGTLAFLIVVEPDLGSGVLLVAVACLMTFIAGLRWRYVGALCAVGAVGFAAGVVAEPYRLQRVVAWLRILSDPSSADAQGANFQLLQSLIAVGRGGVTGVGLGQGQQKAFFVPASHTDFIFSIIGEELGFLGSMALLVTFLLIFWRGLRAAVKAPDRFGFYLALGITCLLVTQALTNMCVCLGLLPTKGLPLPLISYGGSSLLASMAGLGLLFNVSQHSN
jgi:cell division protein FtsW